MTRYRSLVVCLCVFVLWLVAANFANHSAVALMIDQKTGAKFCENKLASYLGVPQSEGIDLLSSVSVILALAIPIVVFAIGLWSAGNKFVRWRSRALGTSK